MILFVCILFVLTFICSIINSDICKEGSNKRIFLHTKGLLSLLIVIHHIAILSSIEYPCKGSFYQVGAIIVSFFFFFSGFGLVKSEKKKIKFMTFIYNSFIKLFVPFVIATFICYILVKNEIVSIPDYSIIQGRPLLPHSWFVLDLACCYVFYGLCCRIKSLDLSIVTLFILLALNALFAYLLKFPENWYGTTISFGFGVLFASFELHIISFLQNKGKVMYTILLSIMSLVIFLYVNTRELLSSPRSVLGLVIVIMLPIIFVLSCYKIPQQLYRCNFSALDYLGSISYEIYLIHGIFLYTIIPYCDNWLGYLLLFIVTFLFSHYVHLYSKKIEKIICRYIKDEA